MRTCQQTRFLRILPGLRLRLGLSSFAALLAWGTLGHAEERREVIIVAPAAETCVVATSLATGLESSGELRARVVGDSTEAVREATPAAAVLQVDGSPLRLRIRAWGLRPEPAGEGLRAWPVPWHERAPDMDREVAARDCATATEAVTAFVVSAVALPPVDGRRGPGDAIVELLERAQAELGSDSGLFAGVLRTELGLTLIVEDSAGRCRRGTWLRSSGPMPHAGLSVGDLRRHVLMCLDERRRDGERTFHHRASPARSDDLRAARRLNLPDIAGVLVLGAGGAAASFAWTRLDQPALVLPYTAGPAVVGGLAGYLAKGRWRDALWLSGYWATVAGSSLTAGAHGGAGKPVLIGGLLAAGASSSAALALFDAMVADDATESSLPAWSIALPAGAGAVLGGLGLLIDGRTENSVQIAAIGGAAALAPALLLALSPSGTVTDRVGARGLRIAVGPSSAVFGFSGEL